MTTLETYINPAIGSGSTQPGIAMAVRLSRQMESDAKSAE